MPDSSRVELLRALVANTSKGLLRWEATPTEGQFQVALSEYTLTARQIPSENGVPDENDYLFSIFNSEGQMVDSFSDVHVASESFDSPDARAGFYRAITDFYCKARSSALGVDQAISSILQELNNIRNRGVASL
jgi:hypothetical protein